MIIRAPWDFGTIVFLRIRSEKIRGMVTGYTFDPRGMLTWVSWPDSSESKHHLCELTTEYLPDYET